MVAVVGPSGAGKDTLLAHAARHFEDREDVIFVRRVITRDPDAGGEVHDGVSEAEFEMLKQAGKFAVCWDAHGLRYGIPVETREAVEKGRLVVANGSRSALPLFRSAFPSLVVVNVTARPEVLASRLEARGRESRQDILQRLERGGIGVCGDYPVVTIDNSGSLDQSGAAMIDVLSSCLPVKA